MESSSEGYSASIAEEGPSTGTCLTGKELDRGAPPPPSDLCRPPQSHPESQEKEEEDRWGPEPRNGDWGHGYKRWHYDHLADAAYASGSREEDSRLSKKDAGSQLLKILTKLAKGQKDKKEKKDKKNRKRRRRVKLEEGGDPSDSSGSSPTPSGGGDSGGSSSSSGDEDKEESKMEAPLRRKSLKRPGSVLRLLINHARQQLDQTAKVEVGNAATEDPTLVMLG